MKFIVVVEPNPLLRLGILHLLSNANTTLNLVAHEHIYLDQHYDSQPCKLAIVSFSHFNELNETVKNIELALKPQFILLLSDTTELPSSLHSISPVIAGCVYKHATPEVLLASIQLVLAGGHCFPCSQVLDTTQGELLSLYEPVKWPPPAKEEASLTAEVINSIPKESEMLGLTPRQYEVLVLLARGHPMKTIGRHLNISVATAKAHTESLYQRLDVNNRNAAVYTAIAQGATLGWKSTPNQQAG